MYLSFFQHKSVQIVCSMEVTFSSWFHTRISFKDPELVNSLRSFEGNWQQTYWEGGVGSSYYIILYYFYVGCMRYTHIQLETRDIYANSSIVDERLQFTKILLQVSGLIHSNSTPTLIWGLSIYFRSQVTYKNSLTCYSINHSFSPLQWMSSCRNHKSLALSMYLWGYIHA